MSQLTAFGERSWLLLLSGCLNALRFSKHHREPTLVCTVVCSGLWHIIWLHTMVEIGTRK